MGSTLPTVTQRAGNMMKEENTNLMSELKRDYSLEEALWLHKFEVIANLVCTLVCMYYVSTLAGNEEKYEIFIKFWVPWLAVAIFALFINLYSVFSLTRCNETHLFVAIFPLQLLQQVVWIGWFSYLIAFVVSVVDASQPYFVFAVFVFSYIILDSITVFIFLISILVKAKPVSTFLCKYWFIRDAVLLIVCYILFCFYAYLLASGRTSFMNIIFFGLSLLQAILFSIYTKKRHFKPETWEPKPLEAKVPEGKMLEDAVLLIAAMEEEKIEAAGAA